MAQSKLHIRLGIFRQHFVKWMNNKKTKKFFVKNHSRIYSPLHSQHVSECCHLEGGVTIFDSARIDCYPIPDKPLPEIHIGENTFINYSFTVLCAEKIIIGKNCMFASNVFVSDENHGTAINGGPYLKQPLSTKPVEIGNNVWLGEKVIVLPGVKIGDNAVIGAGSVVTHDIPKNSMAVGNPAQIIKIWNEENRTWEPINKSSKQTTNGN